MPRTLLAKQHSSSQALKKEIDVRLKEIQRDKIWLSAESGIKYRSLMNKLAYGTFTYDELYRVFQALQMPQQRILILFGR